MSGNKRKKEKSFAKIIVFCFMLVFTVTICTSLYSQTKLLKQLKAEEEVLTARVEEEERENIQLQSQREQYTSDAYIEKMAREKLGLVMPDEIVFKNRN